MKTALDPGGGFDERESLLFRGSTVNFDNGQKNMLKTSQDRLVRASHDSPERLFFPFSDARLKLTNRAGGEGADRQPIGASGGANLAREIGPQRCHGGLGDLFVRTRMDYFSDQTHDIPRLAGPNRIRTSVGYSLLKKVNLRRHSLTIPNTLNNNSNAVMTSTGIFHVALQYFSYVRFVMYVFQLLNFT